jgi:cell division protein FtsL
MKKPAHIILFFVGIIVLLSVVKVIAYNGLSISGVFVGKVEDEINFYKTQNAILSEKLLTLSSLTNISERAEKEGFINENRSIMIIEKSKSLAVKQ